MKKTIFLSAAMALATFGASAQDNAAPATKPVRTQATVEDRAKRQADRINSIAQLTPDQYNKVLEVSKKYAAQKDAIRSSSTPGEDAKAKFKGLNEQEEGELKGILTPEQFTKVQAARKDAQGHRPE